MFLLIGLILLATPPEASPQPETVLLRLDVKTRDHLVLYTEDPGLLTRTQVKSMYPAPDRPPYLTLCLTPCHLVIPKIRSHFFVGLPQQAPVETNVVDIRGPGSLEISYDTNDIERKAGRIMTGAGLFVAGHALAWGFVLSTLEGPDSPGISPDPYYWTAGGLAAVSGLLWFWLVEQSDQVELRFVPDP